MKKDKVKSLAEVMAMPQKQQVAYMNSLPASGKAQLLGIAATLSLRKAGDKVVGN